MLSNKVWGWLLLVTITLSITPTNYHVTFSPDPDNAEVWLIIRSETNGTPYQAIHAQDIKPPVGNEPEPTSLDFPRHPLPKGSYVIEATMFRWVNNELVPVEASGTVVIHVS